MKISDLTKEQKEELEKFGANTWFVEYLHKLYEENPSEIPEQWRNFFKGEPTVSNNGNGNNYVGESVSPQATNFQMPEPGKEDQVKIIAGSAARILDNMTSSLTLSSSCR